MTVLNTNELKIDGQTKQYDRDFLLKLRDIPQCKIKPSYLINRFESIHKNNSRKITADFAPPRLNGFNTKSHHQLFPSFAKPSSGQLLEKWSSSQGNYARAGNSGMIHVSLSLNEDIKLHKSENAWKPTLLKKKTATEEDEETQLLYKKVRSVLNKLTPEKFDKLVGQVRALEIDTEEKLQGVINLVFDKAIDEPNFSVAYVLMCKELALMKVNLPNEKNPLSQNTGNAVTNINFRKLLINRCQAEFEKNTTNETTRVEKVEEIEECKDAEKRKELKLNLAEYDRRIRMKSVGNIKFIGELYKQGMLTNNIMNLCINHLLKTPDEENLECLCKLLTTIGKIFEEKNDLSLYFNKLTELITQKRKNKISSRIRFMIQDVIDLRLSNWISRHDNSNPKTISQIKKQVETEQFIKTHLNAPSNLLENFRSDNRRRNLMDPPNNLSNGWSVATNKSKTYTIQTSQLKINTTSLDEITLGSKKSYTWNKPLISPVVPTVLSPNKFSILGTKFEDQSSRTRSYIGSRSTGFSERSNDQFYQRGTNFLQNNTQQRNDIPLFHQRLSFFNSTQNSRTTVPLMPMEKISLSAPVQSNQSDLNKPLKSEIIKSLFNTCNIVASTEEFIQVAKETIEDKFDSSSYEFFVSETINSVLEKSTIVRQRYSALLSYMIQENIISLNLFQKEYEKLLEIINDLEIDIPKCQTYLVEILSELLISGVHSFVDLKKTLSVLKNTGICGKFLGELLSTLAKSQNPNWVTDKWEKSKLTWSDLFDTERESVNDIITNYSLKFLIDSSAKIEKVPVVENFDFDITLNQLLNFMRENNSFDFITNYITKNFGEQPLEPKFSRCLIIAILTISIDTVNGSQKLNSEKFKHLLPLVIRYVDTDPKRELEILFGIQHFIHNLWYPQGLLSSVVKIIYDDCIISTDAFLSWQKCEDPMEMEGHAIVIKSLTSFFVNLLEGNDDDSEE